MSGPLGGSSLLDANLILAKAQVIEKAKVADLGCGSSGHFIFPSAKLVGKKGMVYAVDILRTSLETINKIARAENFSNIKTVWSNLEIFGATKIESGSLDVAMLINTLHQSRKRTEMIRESVRLIKKHGRLIVVEWKNIATPFGPPLEERVKRDLVENSVRKLGLHLEDEFDAGQYHYGLVYIKF